MWFIKAFEHFSQKGFACGNEQVAVDSPSVHFRERWCFNYVSGTRAVLYRQYRGTMYTMDWLFAPPMRPSGTARAASQSIESTLQIDSYRRKGARGGYRYFITMAWAPSRTNHRAALIYSKPLLRYLEKGLPGMYTTQSTCTCTGPLCLDSQTGEGNPRTDLGR